MISPYFRESGILGGWRGAVSPTETAVVLLMVFVGRIIFMPFEEKLGASKFPPRTGIVHHYMELMASAGTTKQHSLCWAVFVACLFTNISQFAFHGKDKAAVRAAMDD